MMKLFLATNNGFVAAQKVDDAWEVSRRGLDGRYVTTLIAREGVILAGTQDGLFRSGDEGASWQEASRGLTQRHVRWLAYHPDVSDCEFAGTEPAAIFVSRDGGETWQERPEVAALRDEFRWWLPYSPAAGCVRGFAFHGSRAYAAVEVGAALRSDDGGETWRLADGSNGQPRFGRPPAGLVHPDVHSINVHPSDPDLVYAPTGGGFYHSSDGGQTWDCLYENCYVRAVWVDAHDPGHMILGPARDSSGRDGRIEQSKDGGHTWHRLTEPEPRNMVERFYEIGEHLFAVTSNGQLLTAALNNLIWQPILPEIKRINDLTPMAS